MKKTCLILLLALFCQEILAQRYTISGFVEEAGTGEKLIGANVYVPLLKNGTTTNVYGFYSITLPADSVRLIFSYVGFQPKEVLLKLDRDIKLDITLSTSTFDEVVIRGDRPERIEERSRMSTIEVPIAQIKSTPALLGEVDVLKVLQLLPGVQSGGEGTSGLFVRGGSPDQNLILLDGVPVYNASHLFGFFSVFNADAINNVQLIKGGYPARYGGRLSSVIDINMKEGNMKKFGGEGSVGIVASRLTLEGPIKKDKTSFIVSGRRTYIDLLMTPFVKLATEGNGSFGYYFYDLNGKINHKINDRNRLFFSVYTGDDKFYARFNEDFIIDNNKHTYGYEFGLGWGNITSALRWNHVHGNKLFSNTTLTYSRYRFLVGMEFTEKIKNKESRKDFVSYTSGINDWSAKVDFDYIPSPNHYIKFGGSSIYHTFNPGVQRAKFTGDPSTSIDTSIGSGNVYATEFMAYIEDDIRLTEKLRINAGMHLSGFLVESTFYPSIQPRVSGRYLLPKNWSAKASYAKMQQYIHLLTNSSIGLPTDLWLPSTKNIKPQKSWQIATGFAKSLDEPEIELSIEGYYREMSNIIEYLEGNSMFTGADWESRVGIGRGWSYGIELLLQKTIGKSTGWIGYTLSWSKRQFGEEINRGEVFPFKYDRRHDFSIVASHKISEQVDIAATWVYGSGNSITLPVARFNGNFEGDRDFWWNPELLDYGSRNSFRMKSYHRLDAGINFHKETRWGKRTWNLGAYNAYSNRNPFFVYYGWDSWGERRFKQFSLFPIIPSVSYNFKF